MRRVVITGLGVVSPVGIGKRAFWNAISSGRSGVGRITRFDSSPFPTRIAAEVKGFDPNNYMDQKTVERTELSTQFAIAAAKMAMQDSGLSEGDYDPKRIGV
ncbi:MAG TPA: beta-ketoacyl-[acyl-carrier-protein] synthase II, partial [Firmicutes bacterium]|nr:beta-ketoacyl-[acyl-carrier-protein] synthase II [Bacillota bacterium]